MSINLYIADQRNMFQCRLQTTVGLFFNISWLVQVHGKSQCQLRFAMVSEAFFCGQKTWTRFASAGVISSMRSRLLDSRVKGLLTDIINGLICARSCLYHLAINKNERIFNGLMCLAVFSCRQQFAVDMARTSVWVLAECFALSTSHFVFEIPLNDFNWSSEQQSMCGEPRLARCMSLSWSA